MKCPKCNFSKSLVCDSRPRQDDFATMRKRKCQSCDFVYHTVEIFYNKPTKPKVVKPKLKPHQIKQSKKAQMNKRLARLKRQEAVQQIDMMSDEELEEAMFSGQDLKDLGIN